jgi:hypothetical protein
MDKRAFHDGCAARDPRDGDTVRDRPVRRVGDATAFAEARRGGPRGEWHRRVDAVRARGHGLATQRGGRVVRPLRGRDRGDARAAQPRVRRATTGRGAFSVVRHADLSASLSERAIELRRRVVRRAGRRAGRAASLISAGSRRGFAFDRVGEELETWAWHRRVLHGGTSTITAIGRPPDADLGVRLDAGDALALANRPSCGTVPVGLLAARATGRTHRRSHGPGEPVDGMRASRPVSANRPRRPTPGRRPSLVLGERPATMPRCT